MRGKAKLAAIAAAVLVVVGIAGFIVYRNSDAHHIAIATGDGDVSDRLDAMTALFNKGAPEAVIPVYIKLIGDKNSRIRVQAADYLGYRRAKSAVEPLLAALPLQSPYDRPKFIGALGSIGDPRAIAPLVAALETAKDKSEASTITGALAKLGPDVVPILIERLSSPTPALRAAAASGLAGFWREAGIDAKKPAMEAAVEPLIKLLKDPVTIVRTAAASAMGDIRDPRFLAHLVSALGDREDDMHNVLARVISYYGDDAIIALQPGFQSADVTTRMGAAEALAALVYRSHYDIMEKNKPYVLKASAILDDALRRNDLVAGAGAFSYYILQGRPQAVPFLIAALDAHGHKRMADALLNCGMPTLQDAAKAWGTSHGFTIETTSGRSDRTWGKL